MNAKKEEDSLLYALREKGNLQITPFFYLGYICKERWASKDTLANVILNANSVNCCLAVRN